MKHFSVCCKMVQFNVVFLVYILITVSAEYKIDVSNPIIPS